MSPSAPMASSAARAHRSSSVINAVVTKSRARSASSACGVALALAAWKSPITTDPSAETARRCPSRFPCAIPASCIADSARHRSARSLVGHLGRCELLDRTTVGLQHEHPVSRPDHTGGDHGQHRDARALGEQGDERLVFDLLPAADRERRRLVPVPQVGPGRGEQLAVPGVAPIDLDEEWQPLRRLGPQEGHPLGLELGRPQVDRLHPELLERGPHLIQRREPAGRAEREVHERRGAEPDRQPRHHAERQRDRERDHAERAKDDDPAADAADRPAEVRGGRRDQRGRERHPDGRIQGRRARGREPVGQRRNATGYQRRHAGGQDRREELIAEQEQPPRRDDRGDEQDERPQDQQVAGGLPEPPQEPGEVVDQLGDPLVDRRRVRRHDRDQPEGRGGEEDQDDVRRSAGPRGVGAGGEEADAEVGLVPGDPGPGPPARCAGPFGRPGLSGRLGRRSRATRALPGRPTASPTAPLRTLEGRRVPVVRERQRPSELR